MLISCFSLPCTAIAMVLCYLFLRGRPRVTNLTTELSTAGQTMTWTFKLGYIDWIAMTLFMTGGILILLGLNWGPGDTWNTARVIVTLVLGVLLLVLCAVWEIVLERKKRSAMGGTGVLRARPMIPLEMFTSHDMCIVQFGAFVSGMVMFVMFYFVAIFMTVVTGLPASQAGIQLLYFAPGMVR